MVEIKFPKQYTDKPETTPKPRSRNQTKTRKGRRRIGAQQQTLGERNKTMSKNISLILMGCGGVGRQLLQHIVSCRSLHAKQVLLPFHFPIILPNSMPPVVVVVVDVRY